MTIIKTIRKCVEGMILNDIISILLFCAFAYLFNFNFHRDNYAYAIVMFIGMMVFYGDFYHHLPINWKLYILLIATFLWALFTIFMGRQALIKPAQRKHFSYATIIGIFAIIITFIFRCQHRFKIVRNHRFKNVLFHRFKCCFVCCSV